MVKIYDTPCKMLASDWAKNYPTKIKVYRCLSPIIHVEPDGSELVTDYNYEILAYADNDPQSEQEILDYWYNVGAKMPGVGFSYPLFEEGIGTGGLDIVCE